MREKHVGTILSQDSIKTGSTDWSSVDKNCHAENSDTELGQQSWLTSHTFLFFFNICLMSNFMMFLLHLEKPYCLQSQPEIFCIILKSMQLVAWRSGSIVRCMNISYSTLSQVSTRMADWLLADIPPQYVPSQLGQLHPSGVAISSIILNYLGKGGNITCGRADIMRSHMAREFL